jgi:hypothetical protein
LLTDYSRHLGEGHLDARPTVRTQMSLQAFVLLTSHHEHILLAVRRNTKTVSRISPFAGSQNATLAE